MVLTKTYFPGKYIQGRGAIAELPSMIAQYGGKGFLIVTKSMAEKIAKLPFGTPQQTEVFSAECCWPQIDQLMAKAQAADASVIVGIGGGKLVDCAKIVADKLQKPVIMVPTVAASNAACSACAVIYTPEGVHQEVYYQKSNPELLLVDSQIIADAPKHFLVSGMGDALATWFEAVACKTNSAKNCVGGYIGSFGMTIAKATYENLLRYGQLGALACENHVVTPALEAIIETNLLYSGVGFESGGLAAAHGIHNGLTIFPEANRFSHGQKVAFGVLAELHLTGADPDLLIEVYNFCESIGLPTTLQDLGLEGKASDQLLKAAETACEDPYTLHDGPLLTPWDIYGGIVAADKMGMARKHKI